MTPDDLDAVLARVAAGELTPDEAEPLVQQLTRRPEPPAAPPPDDGTAAPADPVGVRAVRVRVRERGREVVDLCIPMALASVARTIIPGLTEAHVARLRSAIRLGERGAILDVNDDRGDGVTITTE